MSNARKQHIEKVDAVYEETKQQLTLLLADLNPAPWNRVDVNPRIEALYNQIRTLRDLACTTPTNYQPADGC